jgi:alanine racemase
LDTGLHRLGFNLDEIPCLITKLKSNCDLIHMKSIFSHFIGSYSPEIDQITRHQAHLFISNSECIENAVGYSIIKHLCNSGGIIHYPDFQFDMVRLGVGLFGLWPIGSTKQFQKIVVSLFSPIIHLQYVKQHETVGYTQFKLNRSSLIGTLKIGYADGLKRHLNNGEGRVWIHGHRIPILSLSMDTTIIDLTDLQGQVKINDQVQIFGEHLPIEEMAQWCKQTSYEFILGFNQRIERIYFEED